MNPACIFEKSQFLETTILNGLQGDPAVYGFFPRSGEGILFDAGSLENLSHKDLLRVRHVAISHTHIDHFIGFDRLIRVNIPHFREISVSGPPGIAKNVQAKIRAYLWNLLDPGQIRYRITEVSACSEVEVFSLSSDHGFELMPAPKLAPLAPQGPSLPVKPVVHVATLSDGTRVEAVPLDHGTKVLAYSCQMPRRYQVVAGSIERLGLTEGAWIGELQKNLTSGHVSEQLEIGGQFFAPIELAEKIFTTLEPRAIGYVTDIVFSRENLDRLRLLLPKVDFLICESNFSHEDKAKAFAKKHLTTLHAALIGAYCGANQLRVFHISNIYAGRAEEVAAEALAHFSRLKSESLESLDLQVNANL